MTERDFPYGYWIGPDGSEHVVAGVAEHYRVAEKLIRDNDPTAFEDRSLSVYSYMQRRGYVRVTMNYGRFTADLQDTLWATKTAFEDGEREDHGVTAATRRKLIELATRAMDFRPDREQIVDNRRFTAEQEKEMRRYISTHGRIAKPVQVEATVDVAPETILA